MLDVLIAGAGPAGAVAALVLARAGVRVLLVDRETFPRDALCGDTLNPGAVRLLQSLQLFPGGVLERGRALAGVRLTSRLASVTTRYDPARPGVAIRRRDLDLSLLEAAITAGARFESGLIVREPLVDTAAGVQTVKGLAMTRRDTGATLRVPALMTIAADGRRSVVASALGLVKDAPGVKRWGFGAYASGIRGTSDLSEVHVWPGWYISLTPMAGDLVNVSVVTPAAQDRQRPVDVIRAALRADPELAARAATAEFADGVRVAGPLAVDVLAPGARGLVLAGDAAGFVDAMTGDGLHLAMQSAVLAAAEVRHVLETGDGDGTVGRLREARRARLGAKLRFNRLVRRLASSPSAVEAASVGARVWPGLIRHVVRYAGDVG